MSQLAASYLEIIAEKYKVDVEKFKDWISSKKETIDSIGSFRDLLCADYESDSSEEMRFKATFRDIGEIFGKRFCCKLDL